MKAVVCTAYGSPDVLKLKDLSKPVPKDDEVLIKIHTATVSAGDCKMRAGRPFAARLYNGVLRPRRVATYGFELAGEVEAAGKDIRLYKPGDQVFAFTGFQFGAYAEFICLKEKGTVTKTGAIARKPDNLSFEEAAAVPAGGMTALGFIKKANLKKGQRILIYGASGSVGTYAVQLAKLFGAHVTGICSTANLEMVASLGADEVIDYTKENFLNSNEVYDIVFDAVGKLKARQIRGIKKRLFISVNSSVSIQPDDLQYLAGLLKGRQLRPVIDKIYPLNQIADAHRYVEQGRKRGNVVITVAK